MSTDDESWRRHEVPTFTQVEDTWIAGLTLKQILGLVMAVGIGYAVFQLAPLWFLPTIFRLGLAAAVTLIIAGFVAIKPGGRSMFGLVNEYISLYFGLRYMVEDIDNLFAPTRRSAASSRKRSRFKLPFIGGSGSVLIFLLGGLLLTACGSEEVNAQIAEDYYGRRVYLQSIVVDLNDDNSRGGSSATVRLKAAAPLATVDVGVNETLQSVTELAAHRTRTQPALTRVGGTQPIPGQTALETGQQFIFENVYLGDRLSLTDSDKAIRPYCDISTSNFEGLFITTSSEPTLKARGHAADCRILSAGALKPGTAGLEAKDALSKPHLTVKWRDRKRNVGALGISHGMLPYPKPAIIDILPIDYITEIVDTSNQARLFNRFSLCAPHQVKVVKLGIQRERPTGLSASDDYFDGQSGRRLAGEVQICRLSARFAPSVEVLLPEMVVFGRGNSAFEMKVRPMVSTTDPGANIVNNATLKVSSPNAPEDGDLASISFQELSSPLGFPTVKFNVPIGDALLAPKTYSTDLDSATIRMQVDMEHRITVKRPPEQRIEHYPPKLVTHLTSCGCSSRGGTCGDNGGSCSCSCTAVRGFSTFEYYPDHYRVDPSDRLYTQDSASADITYTFQQTFTFEDILITFDEPYEELIYVEPTPEPGRIVRPDYVEPGGKVAPWKHDILYCTPDTSFDDDGDWTGWIWVEPGINSKGEEYGGCRLPYACKLKIPEQEEPFGPGGTPTEEDYECLNN